MSGEKCWIIYGAYGYTGKLIAAEAAARGLKPTLAGRDPSKTEQLASELGLPFQAFAIESVEQVSREIAAFDLVLNCAGPFWQTADVLVDACIKRGIHYLDISGEPEMFEKHFARQEQAAASGSVLIPGVGFDVVPTDTLAANLVNELGEKPDSLELAFYGEGSGSAGSAKTVLGMMSGKCLIRRNGKITRVPLAKYRKSIRFSDREEWCVSIPWGDVSTAYHSTNIPNITVYMAMPRKAGNMMRLTSPLMSLVRIPAIKRSMFKKIDSGPAGPDAEERNRGFMRVWGQVCTASGRCLEGTIDTVQGFNFTTRASLLYVTKVLESALPGGCYTPTQAFGPNLAMEIEGTVLQLRH